MITPCADVTWCVCALRMLRTLQYMHMYVHVQYTTWSVIKGWTVCGHQTHLDTIYIRRITAVSITLNP